MLEGKGKLTAFICSSIIFIGLIFSIPLTAYAACTDMDGDGYGSPGDISCLKGSKLDCNDNDNTVYPGAPKICDGKDNNCDGIKDFSSDEDKDHDGVMWCANDCDDVNAAKFPGNYEIYGTPACTDGMDNDCNGRVDRADATCTTPCIDKDGDGYGKPGTSYCTGGAATDCNDADAAMSPGRQDNDCNGVDNDCDGQKDEAFVVMVTNCGIGACANTGQNLCMNGTAVNTCATLPAGTEGPVGAPSCNDGIDNNCNGTVDMADGFCMDVCIDLDGDGYGANGASVCTVPLAVDCNDTDPNINPGVTDSTCNGIDENCSGAADEGYVPTATNCGVGACSRTGQLACQAAALVNTCTAGAPVIEGPLGKPTCTDNIDNNCDGLTDASDPNCQVSCIDKDNDGYGNPGDISCRNGSRLDCNDNDPKVYPGAPKICDGKDNNCDGIRDFTTDVDQDGDGVMWCANDCDDRNANRYPGYVLIYGSPACSDNVDNDCDGKIEVCIPCSDKDSDGYGKPGSSYCPAGPQTDCNDANAAIHPGVPDNVCNGVDEDCDGLKDEDVIPTTTNCGIGECANTGSSSCVNGVLVNTCVPLPPKLESPLNPPTCIDGKDNNCNGLVDNADASCEDILCIDNDGDGYSVNGSPSCQAGPAIDCNDTNPNINPGKTDTTCDGVDDDCSGTPDDGYIPPPTICGVGACYRGGLLACQIGILVDTCLPGSPVTEGPQGSPTCTDWIDNDCDGLIDANDPDCLVGCLDRDGDGFGSPGAAGCPSGSKLDCNDNDNKVYPGAPKICDAKDSNCDGLKDFSTDEDKDGDGVPWCANDCDDRNPNRSPLLNEGWGYPSTCTDTIDNDCDAKTDAADPGCACIDSDGDGYGTNSSPACKKGTAIDCTDSNANINPGAQDNDCNGIDENCSGTADEGYTTTVSSCGIGACLRSGQNICQNGTIVNTCVPGVPMPEENGFEFSCWDFVDNDCDGLTDGQDPGCHECIDRDLDGYGSPAEIGCPGGGANDCDDTDPLVFPGAPKICDGKDNNCDGLKDFTTDEDKDGDGVPWCANDCDDNDARRSPKLYENDLCGIVGACIDAIDNDCNLKADGADIHCDCADCDKDGYGISMVSGTSCPGGSVIDCNDSNPVIKPGALENCTDNIDNNCNGLIDAADPNCTCFSNSDCPASYYCGKANGACTSAGTCQRLPTTCTAVVSPVCGCDFISYANGCEAMRSGVNVNSPGQCSICVPATEGPFGSLSCNDTIDNNCDGLVDGADPNCLPCNDADGDGYGCPGSPACPAGAATDCDCNAYDSYPNGIKICDGKDNNCDGLRDFPTDVDQNGNGIPVCAGDCCDNTPYQCSSTRSEGPLDSPSCRDGVDNNCNGYTDLDDAGCSGSIVIIY